MNMKNEYLLIIATGWNTIFSTTKKTRNNRKNLADRLSNTFRILPNSPRSSSNNLKANTFTYYQIKKTQSM